MKSNGTKACVWAKEMWEVCCPYPGVYQCRCASLMLDFIGLFCTEAFRWQTQVEELKVRAPCWGSPVFSSVSNTHRTTSLLPKQKYCSHQLSQCPEDHVHLILMSNSSLKFPNKPSKQCEKSYYNWAPDSNCRNPLVRDPRGTHNCLPTWLGY